MSGRSDDRPELTFDDLIADPIVRAIMKADGIGEREVRELFDHARENTAQRQGKTYPAESVQSDRRYALRRGVGIVLLNDDGRVFVGQRRDMSDDAWQMPQGGIDSGESPRLAALRELHEEIGTANADILAETLDWLSYELPPTLLNKLPTPRWRGQTQQWFLMRFRGRDQEITVATEHPEFSAWRWAPASQLLTLIVPFKRELYRRVLKEFAPYLPTLGPEPGA